jgi:hypothetical protein
MTTWLGCVNAAVPPFRHSWLSPARVVALCMDVLPSPPELSSDIQRAIQQAVGQANHAFITHQDIDQPIIAKKKRNKERANTEDTQVVKGKKRRNQAPESAYISQESSSIVAADQLKPRSKKSKKATPKQSTEIVPDKGGVNGSLVSSSGSLSHPQPPATFIGAVVSAPPVTSANSNTPYGFPQPCFDSSASSYPYSTIPNDLPLNTPAFQPPISFSEAAIPGLEYASSDDILRALQDLDVTKVASVLKTLGEAAAAANIPLTSLPSTLLQRPQPTTSIDATPDIVESTAQRVLQHRRHLVDVNTHQEPLEHSDHAELLATKWLGASKLKELARSQGQCQCHLESPDVQFSPFVIGLVYKKGKFSAIEEQQLSDAIKAYKEVSTVSSQVKIPLMAILGRHTRLTTRRFTSFCLPNAGRRRAIHFGLPSVRALVAH